MYTNKTSINKKKEIVNSDGKRVPDRCPKCGSEIGLFIKGEPVYLCKNKGTKNDAWKKRRIQR